MPLTVRVIAPDKTVWDSQAEEVILPSTTGQLGILGGHAPMLTALDTGVMRVRSDKNTWVPIALMGGFAEVDADEVIILVNGAERGDSIDKEEVELIFGIMELDGMSDVGKRKVQSYIIEPPSLYACLQSLEYADEQLRYALMVNLVDTVWANDELDSNEEEAIQLAKKFVIAA